MNSSQRREFEKVLDLLRGVLDRAERPGALHGGAWIGWLDDTVEDLSSALRLIETREMREVEDSFDKVVPAVGAQLRGGS